MRLTRAEKTLYGYDKATDHKTERQKEREKQRDLENKFEEQRLKRTEKDD